MQDHVAMIDAAITMTKTMLAHYARYTRNASRWIVSMESHHTRFRCYARRRSSTFPYLVRPLVRSPGQEKRVADRVTHRRGCGSATHRSFADTTCFLYSRVPRVDSRQWRWLRRGRRRRRCETRIEARINNANRYKGATRVTLHFIRLTILRG